MTADPLVPCSTLRPGDAVLVKGRWRLVERVEDRDSYVYLFTDAGEFVARPGARRRVRRAVSL